MSSKTSPVAPPNEAAAVTSSPLNMLADLGRQQLALAAEGACALFRGSEAMREIQHQAAHQACAHHEEAVQKLRGTCEPADLLAIQTDLLRFNLQGAAEYWQGLMANALKTQFEMMGCANRVFGAKGDSGFKPTLDAWQAAVTESLTRAANWPAVQQGAAIELLRRNS